LLLLIGAAASALYVWHAGRTPHPLLNLSLLKVPTFRASVTGGFLFRVGVGATPFLLPLMLQVGFGFSPIHSGLLTFVAAAGAMAMKFTAPQLLRRFGFRPILVWNSLICAAMLGAYALIRADTPALLVWLLLLTSGFFRSLLFTSLNAVAYADIPPERMSQATSFSSMGQQLSLSFGVGFGALVLHLVSLHQHTQLVPEDFTVAFVAVAAVSALSTFSFRALPEDAGSELTGVRAARSRAEEVVQPGA
jgi:MFS family permease